MGKTRKFAIKFGGSESNEDIYDGRISVKYFNIFANSEADQTYATGLSNRWSGGKVEDYDKIFQPLLTDTTLSKYYPIICSFYTDIGYGVNTYQGMSIMEGKNSASFSIYRREYGVYTPSGYKREGYFNSQNNLFYQDRFFLTELPKIPNVYYVDLLTNYYYLYDSSLGNFVLTDGAKMYIGEWEPVLLSSSSLNIYDYNVCNDKTYQYLLYMDDFEVSGVGELDTPTQVFANSSENYSVWKSDPVLQNQGKLIKGGAATSNILGSPVVTHWEDWVMYELIPEEAPDNIPLVKKIYKVNPTQIWKFRFSLETEEQKQNISRTEFQTLGQFPKIGYGKMNYISGSVTALMGSEIVLGTQNKYIERTSASRLSPLSTNEKVKMLEQWKELVASPNPKLLKDMKGQAWIVQIISAGNTTKNFYNGIPDTISFQWKQIDDVKNAIIYSEPGTLKQENDMIGKKDFEPIFK